MCLFDVIQNKIEECFWTIRNLPKRINTHVANATDKNIYAKVDAKRINVIAEKDKQALKVGFIEGGKIFLFDN